MGLDAMILVFLILKIQKIGKIVSSTKVEHIHILNPVIYCLYIYSQQKYMHMYVYIIYLSNKRPVLDFPKQNFSH